MIPFLYSVRNAKNKKDVFLKGTILGITIFVNTSLWLYYPLVNFSGMFVIPCLFIVSIAFILLGLIYGIWAWLYVYPLKKMLISPFWLAISWTGIEYLRYRLLEFFPFGFAGYTQVGNLHILQLADIGGVFLLSFVVIILNGYLYKAYLKHRLRYLIPVLLILITIVSYGGIRLNLLEKQTDTQFQVGIVQTNLTPEEKWKFENIEDNYKSLLKKTALLDKVKLVIWPESALTFDLIRNDFYRSKFNNLLTDINIHIQAGSLAIIDDEMKKYNSAFLLSPDGKVITRYNKMKLVPFGEYLPFPELVELITGYTTNSEYQGEELKIFNLDNVNWKTAICSEILNHTLMSKEINRVDFIVNQSNEAWYRRGNLQQQMWTAAIFRAVENRRPVVKASNKAYGGIILATGESLVKLHAEKEPSYQGEIPLMRINTTYQKWGDFIGYLSAGLTILLVLIKLTIQGILLIKN